MRLTGLAMFPLVSAAHLRTPSRGRRKAGIGPATALGKLTAMEQLRIGRVIKSHGVRGEVVVEPTTDHPEVRFAPGQEIADGLTIATVRGHQGRLLIKFQEIADRNAADGLRGREFFAAPLEDEDDDGFYPHELEGLRVIHDGKDIGVVLELLELAGRDLLRLGISDNDVLVPFVADIVPEVDLDAGTVTITPPEGLLDI